MRGHRHIGTWKGLRGAEAAGSLAAPLRTPRHQAQTTKRLFAGLDDYYVIHRGPHGDGRGETHKVMLQDCGLSHSGKAGRVVRSYISRDVRLLCRRGAFLHVLRSVP